MEQNSSWECCKVLSDQFIPCDLVLLACSEPKGTLFIETKNLDGETNLKIKNVQKDINPLF
jgi:phospholipid-transporting ATPase